MVSSTTFEAIRTHQLSVIESLTPSLAADVPFRAVRYPGRFETWAENNADRSLRSFTIRLTGREYDQDMPLDMAVDRVRLLVAYPTATLAAYGDDDLLDLDAMLTADYELIRQAIGITNHARWASYQISCLNEQAQLIYAAGVTYLAVDLAVRYYSRAPAVSINGGSLAMLGSAALTAATTAQLGGAVGMTGTGAMTATGTVQDFATNENGYYFPATIAESTAIGGTLDHIWLMQASAAPIEDEQTAGTDYDLSTDGAGASGLDYQQTRTGWTRKFIHWDSELVASFIFPSDPFNTTTTSQVSILLIECGATAAGTKNILVYGSSGAANISLLGNGRLRLNINAVTYDSTLIYENDGEAHLLALEFDQRGGKDARFRTEDETVEAAWDAGVGNAATKRLGAATGTGEYWVGYFGLALGANAEALIDANPISVYTV